VVFLQDFGEARTGKLCSLVGIENLKDTDGQGSGQRTDAEELLRDVPGKQSKNCLYEKEDDLGNVASWNNIVAFFTDSYERIHSHIKVLGVIADSGFYLKQFLEGLEEEPLTYIIAVRLLRPLQRQIDIRDYRFSAWITNAKEPAYGVGTL
jgi:hypothetical protein